MEGIMIDNKNLLLNQISTGSVILITGAGFSASLNNNLKEKVPLVSGTIKSIWHVGFGDAEITSNSLQTVYDVCMNEGKQKTQEILTNLFTVDKESISEEYIKWMKYPWKRIYTFNIDDGPEKACIKDSSLNDYIEIINGRNYSAFHGNKTPLIKLHGSVEDINNIVFGGEEYAALTARPDHVYHQFIQDISEYPVVVVGCSLNESALSHYLALRNQDSKKAYRPYSWVISPNMPIDIKKSMRLKNFNHFEMYDHDFFHEVLSNTEIRDLSKPADKSSLIISLSEKISSERNTNFEFLSGSKPTWADAATGNTIKFERETEIFSNIQKNTENLFLIRGNAGSGKSTTLKNVALLMQKSLKNIGVVSDSTEFSISELISQSNKESYDYLIIDDIDRFGSHGIETILNGLQKTKIIASIRTTRVEDLLIPQDNPKIKIIPLHRISLTDSNNIFDLMFKNKRLGVLRDKFNNLDDADFKNKIIDLIDKKHKQRELISTFIYLSKGKDFDDYINEECLEILKSKEKEKLKLYLSAALLYWAREMPFSRTLLLSICYNNGADYSAYKKVLNGMLDSNLLIRWSASSSRRDSEPLIAFRHRVIGEKVIDYFKDTDILLDYLVDLICWSYLAEGKTRKVYYKRFINHSSLQSLLKNNKENIIKVYKEAEEFAEDFHYWLHRGSYETTIGDYESAKNSLGYASYESSNKKELNWVETAQLLLEMKELNDDYDSPSVRSEILIAMQKLTKLVPNSREKEFLSPHATTILIEQGLTALEKKSWTFQEKKQIIESIYKYGRAGSQKYSTEKLLQDKWQEFFNKYKMIIESLRF